MNDHPFVSVIIPTYRDGWRLQKCLDALGEQSYPAARFEILVVNNDSTTNDLTGHLPDNARVVHEPQPGSYSARNAGIGEAEGEILAFTDADCIPSESWVENAVAALQDGNDRVAGHITVFSEHEGRRSLGEAYEFVFAFKQENNARSGTSVTANMVCWRYCFDQTGLFNDQLFSGGDMEWSHRATRAGLGIEYVADVMVHHPARASVTDLFTKRRRVAGGSSVIADYKQIRFSFLRGLTPPVFAFSAIFASPRITFLEKVALIPVSYIIKLYSTFAKVGTKQGWLAPTRK